MQDQQKNLIFRNGGQGDYSCLSLLSPSIIRGTFYCSLISLTVFLLSFLLLPYIAIEYSQAHAEIASASAAWGTVSLELDPDYAATQEYDTSSGASGSRIGDAGHGDINFSSLNPTSRDASSHSYGTLKVLKKTIAVSTSGKYYTVYLSMSAQDINHQTNNNALNLVTASSGGSTTATDSTINLPAIGNGTTTGTFSNPVTFMSLNNNQGGTGWGFAVPNANGTGAGYGNISNAGNFLTSYYTASAITADSSDSLARTTYNNALWAGVPTADSPAQIWKQTTDNVLGFTNDTFDIYYAVAVDTNTLAGIYENNIVYTALANSSAVDKASTNLLRDKAFGGAGDILTIHFDLTDSTAALAEDAISIKLVPHDVMVANHYTDASSTSPSSTFTDANLTAIITNATNLTCPIVANSLDVSTGSSSDIASGKTTSIQCTVPTHTPESGDGSGTYDIWLHVDGYNYNYLSVYDYNHTEVGAFVYAGLQSEYANSAAGATNPDVRYVAGEKIVTKMQEMSPGICANTNRFNNKWGDATRILDPNGNQMAGIDYSSLRDSTAATASIAEGVGSFALTDTRDGKRYLVRRLADGNCWMVQNLDLALYSGMTLSATDTDTTENWTLDPSIITDEARKGSTSRIWQATHGVETVTLYRGIWDDTANAGTGGWVETVVESCTGGTQQAPCFAISSSDYVALDGNNNFVASNQTNYLADTAYAKYTFDVYRQSYALNDSYGYQKTSMSSDSCVMYVDRPGNLYDLGSGQGYCRLETSGAPMITQEGYVLNSYNHAAALPEITTASSGHTIPEIVNQNRAGQAIRRAQDQGLVFSATSAGDYRWRLDGLDGAHAYRFYSYTYGTNLSDNGALTYYEEDDDAENQGYQTTRQYCSTASRGYASGTLTLDGNVIQSPVCYDTENRPMADWKMGGTYYNFYAATAGTGVSTVNRTSESICPKGWTIPSEHKTLMNAMAGSKTKNSIWVSVPASLILPGWYDPSEYAAESSGGIRVSGSYLIDTVSDKTDDHSFFIPRSQPASSRINARYGLGTTLRCVAR